MSAAEVEAFVRSEYWRLAKAGRIPYDLPVCPPAPPRIDHRSPAGCPPPESSRTGKGKAAPKDGLS